MNLLSKDEWRRLFDTFEHTAFRLEVRDSYNEPIEHESFRKFLAGEADDLAWFQSWLSHVRESTAAGKRWARVRVVSVPLTDYSRWGLQDAQYTVAAGDDIRYLTRTHAQEQGLPNHDYWLFDSRKLVRLHFDDDDGHLLGGEIIEDPAVIVQHNYWRDVAQHWAIRQEDFAAQQDVRCVERP